MNTHEIDLTLALYCEHQQRTAHDPRGISITDQSRRIGCNVCLYLGKLLQAAELAQCPPEEERI